MKQLFLLLLLLFSININAQWVLQSDNLNVYMYKVQFTSDNTGFIVGTINSANYFIKTTNSGNNWNSSLIPYISSSPGKQSFVNDNTGWICGFFYNDVCGMVLKTTNQGQTWDSTRVAYTYALIDIQFVNNNTGWTLARSVVHTGYSIFKSTNGGLNWYSQLTINGSNINLYDQHFVNSNVGFITGTDTNTNTPLIYKTTNSGVNWNRIDFSNDFICDNLFFVNENTGYTVSMIGNISKTTNGGYNWISKVIPDLQKMYLSVFFLNENTGYVSGWDFSKSSSLIIKTSNGGNNWVSQIANPNTSLKSIFFINPNTGWTVGNNKIFKTINGGSTFINQISTEIPSEFSLSQNYPNPFNPTTSIKFEIPKTSLVKISVFDVTGKELEVLVNEQLHAGTYQTIWNGSNYSSGVYYYRINSGNYTETKRMALIK